MAQQQITLSSLFNTSTNSNHIFTTSDIFDKNKNKLLSTILLNLDGNLSALENVVNTFLTGEENNDGTINRLKELVAAIQANASSIDDIISGYVKEEDVANNLTTVDAGKVLDARQGKALNDAIALKVATADIVDDCTHTDTNKPLSANQGKALKDALDTHTAKFTETQSGDLVYNTKDLTETGIAIGSSAATATDFHGKLKIITETYTYDDGESESESA